MVPSSLIFVLLLAAVVASAASPPQVCDASGLPPVILGEPLGFCGHTGISCCDTVDDEQLQEEFNAMGVVSDARCASRVKLLLCARCVPGLPSSGLSTADQATAIRRSIPLICASTSSSNSSVQRHPVGASSWSHKEKNFMCLERISARSFQAMVAHPDAGSDHVFFNTLDGKILEATMPKRGSGGALRVRLFADLTDLVHHDGVLGLVGMAFHPDFSTNCLFFVSYICDSRSSPACGAGRCWAAATANGSPPCRYQLVVAEFYARRCGTAGSSEAAHHAAPSEVRRIFTMGLPHAHELYSYQRHVGQILFRPGFTEGYYLYLITGYGGFSKDGRSLYGKILRFNVGGGGSSRGTPQMMDMKPEIYATGLNNPSGCSFDSDSSSDLFCADVNEKLAEMVYLVKAGAASYDGGSSRSSSIAATIVSLVVNRGRPKEGRMPSIVGGRVYRGIAYPWLNGRYLYVYSSRVWILRSRSPVRVGCSKKSPVPCGGSSIIGGRVLSLGEDNSGDAFFLTDRGVFRVVANGDCTAPAVPQPPGTNWVMSVLAFAVVFALYMIWCRLASGGGRISILPNFLRNARLFVIDYSRRADV